MSARISLVVCTLNEANNIGDCVRSAKELVDEIVVVDMHSDDKTGEIAKSLGATVYLAERLPFVDPTRNHAISLATGDWIVMIDADERLTPDLAAELRGIAENDQADVIKIYRETHMFGRRIRYTGWQGEYHYHFFKRGFLSFPQTEVHPHPVIKGRQLQLRPEKGVILHFNYRDFRHFVEKLNNYTDGEALKLIRLGGRTTPLRGVYWGSRHFFRRYFSLRGYRDGIYGFILSVFMGFYWFLAFCKAWELDNKKRFFRKKVEIGCPV